MMFNSSNADLKHFFHATQIADFRAVRGEAAREPSEGTRAVPARRAGHERQRARRAAREVRARPRHSDSHAHRGAKELIVEDGRVTRRARERTGRRDAHHRAARRGAGMRRLLARCRAHRAGLSACAARRRARVAGAARQHRRRRRAWPSALGGARGDPLSAAGGLDAGLARAAAATAAFGVFPHLLDRYKPGIIGVTRNGRRFTNESNSYHDVGAAMIDACADERETAMWLICDHATIRKYGLGFAKPAPMPLGPHAAQRLSRSRAARWPNSRATPASTPRRSKRRCATTTRDAVHGEDPQFGRGTTSFNRYLGDPAAQAESVRRADRRRPVLRAEGGDGRPRHLRRHRDQRRRARCSTRRRADRRASTRSATTAPASWAATIRARASRSGRS